MINKKKKFLLFLLIFSATFKCTLRAHNNTQRISTNISYLGDFYREWAIPTNLLSEKSRCISIEHENISFEIGLLATFNCFINFFTSDTFMPTIEDTISRIEAHNVAYVGYDETHILKTSLTKKIQLHHLEELNIQKSILCDLLKINLQAASAPIIERFFEHNIYPKILCLRGSIEQNEKFFQILRKKYTLLHNDKKNFTFILNEYRSDKIADITELLPSKLENSKVQSNYMKIHEYFLDLFKKNPVETEFKTYQILLNNPLNKNINYLAMPWYILIHNTLHNKKVANLHKVGDIKIDGGFTICQHIFYDMILHILKKIGIDTLFAPHVDKEFYGLRVLPFPHYAMNGTPPAAHKDIWYSFIGVDTHHTRRKIFDVLTKYKQPQKVIIKEREQWHFDRDLYHPNANTKEQQRKEKLEYQDVMARSRFSLCPRGTGVSTIRFWESLQAGAIPVVLADDMQYPCGFDWNSCVIQIPEKDVLEVNDFLLNISPRQEKEMRANCLKAYELFSGDNMVSCIRTTYDA